MVISPYRTTVTKAHQEGKRLADCEADPINRRGKDFLSAAYAMGKRATEDNARLKLAA